MGLEGDQGVRCSGHGHLGASMGGHPVRAAPLCVGSAAMRHPCYRPPRPVRVPGAPPGGQMVQAPLLDSTLWLPGPWAREAGPRSWVPHGVPACPLPGSDVAGQCPALGGPPLCHPDGVRRARAAGMMPACAQADWPGRREGGRLAARSQKPPPGGAAPKGTRAREPAAWWRCFRGRSCRRGSAE